MSIRLESIWKKSETQVQERIVEERIFPRSKNGERGQQLGGIDEPSGGIR